MDTICFWDAFYGVSCNLPDVQRTLLAGRVGVFAAFCYSIAVRRASFATVILA